MSQIEILARRTLEEHYIGKLCSATHIVGVTPRTEFWLHQVFNRGLDYVSNQSANLEWTLKGIKTTWQSNGVYVIDFNLEDKLLIVDVARNTYHSTPRWNAIIVYGEALYAIGLEMLVLE